jgi:hypothetical protein
MSFLTCAVEHAFFLMKCLLLDNLITFALDNIHILKHELKLNAHV